MTMFYNLVEQLETNFFKKNECNQKLPSILIYIPRIRSIASKLTKIFSRGNNPEKKQKAAFWVTIV